MSTSETTPNKDEICSIVSDFMDCLKSHNCLVDQITDVSEKDRMKIALITRRFFVVQNYLEKLTTVMDNGNLFNAYCNFNKSYNFTQEEIINSYGSMMVNYFRSSFELTFLLLKLMLKNTNYNGLGHFLNNAECATQCQTHKKLQEFINYPLRNAIAHDDWWIDGGKLVFDVDDSENFKSYTLEEFDIEVTTIAYVYQCFLDKFLGLFSNKTK